MWDAAQVRQLRVGLELSQTEFAELLGCRQQTVSEWETGMYLPGNAYGRLLDMLRTRVPLRAIQSSDYLKNSSLPRTPESTIQDSVTKEKEYEAPRRFQSDFDAAID